MPKYRIPGPLSFVISGKTHTPDKQGLYDLTEAQAEHLGTVYQVTEVGKDEEKVIGTGTANIETVQPSKAEISKASLVALTNEELDKKIDMLGLAKKIDKDASKGDKAEAILNFVKGLTEKAKK